MKIFKPRLWRRQMIDILYVISAEFRTIFRDSGVRLLFIIAPLAYPILYGFIYQNEALRNVPIAVVDNSASHIGQRYITALDATPEVNVEVRCSTMDEAMQLYERRQVHGIVVIPLDFNADIARGQPTKVAVYTDMSSFMYYKAVMTSTSYVTRQMGLDLQLNNLTATGLTQEQASVAAEPFRYAFIPLFNQTGGYASFLLPLIYILILFQTLMIGIGMRAGTEFERNPRVHLNRLRGHSQSVFGAITGKAICYFLLYATLSIYVLMLVPRWFGLPADGHPLDVMALMIPFLLSTIFFAMTLSVFFHNRENSMVLLLFGSLIFLFISGVSWPMSAVPSFWKVVGWFLPSTHGMQGYVRLNSMNAPLSAVSFEYMSLWFLTGFYFVTAYVARWIQLLRLKSKK